MIALVIALTVTTLFFAIFFTIYVIECKLPWVEPATRAGRSRRGVPVPKGRDAEVIMGFPMFVYSEVKEHKIGKGVLECAVCLSEFEDYEMLRLIPKCDHVFHPECIDEWLSGHVTCPVCRTNLPPPSGDSVKCRAAESGPQEQDRVEIDVDERTVTSEEVMRGRNEEDLAEQSYWDCARESHSGTSPRRLGRSHSTGHSLVRPGDDTELFMLKLPDEVRKQIMERPTTPYFPGEGSSRKGFRSGDGSKRGRFLRRLDWLDLMDGTAKSERWFISNSPSFPTRVSSMVTPKSLKFANDGCRVDRVAKSSADRD